MTNENKDKKIIRKGKRVHKSRNSRGRPIVLLRDAIYLESDNVNVDHIIEHYTTYIYDDNVCNRCDNFQERHNYICDSCPIGGFTGKVSLSRVVVIDGKSFLRIPIGDRTRIRTLFDINLDEYRIIDKRTNKNFRHDIVFTGELRDYQVEATDIYSKARHGVLMSPPRSGKTMMGTYMAVKSGLRTIIVADQHDFLRGFEEHIEKFTNLMELEEISGKKLYGFPKTLEDFDRFEICLCTYQQFIQAGTGDKRLRKLNENYGFLLVDECHKANSTTFSKMVSRVRSTYKIGLSATPERKDGREFIVEALLGPVFHSVDIPMLVPTIYLYDTQCAPKNNYVQWVAAMRYLSNNKKRNAMIVSMVLKDLKVGRSIVIPVTFKDHVTTLVDAINEGYGSEIAQPFVGGGSNKNKEFRNSVIENCRSRKTRVIVGIRSLMQLGLNVDEWSTLYVVIPISNKPNWKQESSRILTPLEGKKPVIRMFVDIGMGQSTGCFRNTYNQSMEFGYKLSKKASKEIGKFMSGGKRTAPKDVSDEYKPVRSDDEVSRPKSKLWGKAKW